MTENLARARTYIYLTVLQHMILRDMPKTWWLAQEVERQFSIQDEDWIFEEIHKAKMGLSVATYPTMPGFLRLVANQIVNDLYEVENE